MIQDNKMQMPMAGAVTKNMTAPPSALFRRLFVLANK